MQVPIPVIVQDVPLLLTVYASPRDPVAGIVSSLIIFAHIVHSLWRLPSSVFVASMSTIQSPAMQLILDVVV